MHHNKEPLAEKMSVADFSKFQKSDFIWNLKGNFHFCLWNFEKSATETVSRLMAQIYISVQNLSKEYTTRVKNTGGGGGMQLVRLHWNVLFSGNVQT